MFEVSKTVGPPEVGTDPGQRLPFDDRTDVIEHQAPNGNWQRQIRRAADPHANQPAHARSDPIKHPNRRARLQGAQHRKQVGNILRNLVAGRIRQPIAAASSHNIRTDYANRF
jgi:hypothetical protein